MLMRIIVMSFLLIFLLPFNLQAAVIHVTTTTQEVASDVNGNCSLTEAILSANKDMAYDACEKGAGVDEIILDSNQVYSIVFTNGEGSAFPPILHGVTIRGNGSTLRREGEVVTRFMTLNSAEDVVIENLAFESGLATYGGAIYVESGGHVYFNHDQFISNRSSQKGGAYSGYNVKAHFNECLFDGNTADILGGAIENSHDLFIEKSTFVNNKAKGGGAISYYPLKGQYFQIKNSLFKDNVVTSNGGALFMGTDAIGFIEGSVFENNQIDETCLGNQCKGGAIFMATGQGENPLIIANSSFYKNKSLKGGAIYVSTGKATLMNATILDNDAPVGAGIFMDTQFGKVDIVNSIIVGNLDSLGTSEDCNSINSLGHNVVGKNCLKNAGPSDIVGANSQDVVLDWVDGIANKAHASLAPSSPALNFGDTNYCVATGDPFNLHLELDQLGRVRDTLCDAGSIEAYCGDGVVHAILNETCDDGNQADGDGCSNICLLEVAAGSNEPVPGEPGQSEPVPNEPAKQEETPADNNSTTNDAGSGNTSEITGEPTDPASSDSQDEPTNEDLPQPSKDGQGAKAGGSGCQLNIKRDFRQTTTDWFVLGLGAFVLIIIQRSKKI